MGVSIAGLLWLLCLSCWWSYGVHALHVQLMPIGRAAGRLGLLSPWARGLREWALGPMSPWAMGPRTLRSSFALGPFGPGLLTWGVTRPFIWGRRGPIISIATPL